MAHFLRGRSTIFALNCDGSIDEGDNGQGFFGYATRSKTLMGVSLPLEVVRQTIGNYGLPDVFGAIAARRFLVQVRNVKNGRSILAPIVDLGPAAWTGNLVDLLYAPDLHLGTQGDGTVEIAVFDPDGNSLELKGFLAKSS